MKNHKELNKDNNKHFCENCRNYVDITQKHEEKSANIKNIAFNYTGRQAYCKACNSPIWTAENQDYNLTKLYEKYNEITN